MPPRGGQKGDKKLLKVEDHFRNLSRSLQFLRKSEESTDVRLVCIDGRTKKAKTLMAHKAIFAPHSKLLTELFEIAKAEMPGQLIVITLDNIDGSIVEKLLEYVYMGQTTVSKAQRSALEDLCQMISFDLKLYEATPQSDSENEVPEVSKKKPVASTKSDCNGRTPDKKVGGPLSEKKKRHESADSPKKKSYSSDEETCNNDQKLKQKAINDRTVISLEPVEKSSDKTVQKYYKNVVANPLFSGTKSSGQGSQQRPTPQKRRMAEETEKKPEAKDSKKMRADDSDGSSSDIDAEAVAKRKQEALVGRRSKSASPKPTAAKRASSTSSDRSDSSKRTKSPVPTKKRIGPRKGAKKLESPPAGDGDAPKKRVGRPPKSACDASPVEKKATESKQKGDKAPIDDMYVTQEIQTCSDCGSIFLSQSALETHVKSVHSTADESDADKTKKKYRTSSSDEEKRSPSPPVKKKSAARIKAERRQSKRSSDSDSHADSDEDAPPRKQVSKTPSSSAKKPSTPRAKTERMSRDDDGESGASMGTRKCRLCEETFDKPQNLKNHVLNHFKTQLFAKLPSSKPFACPLCQTSSRDRITLMRHYAFTHKQYLEYCSEEDLLGIGDGSSSARKSSESKLKVRLSSKRSKKASTSDSEDHSDSSLTPKKNEAAKSKARDSEDEAGMKSNGEAVRKPGQSDQVKFSDDSDDDFVSSETSKALKSFDDLLAGDDSDGKEKSEVAPAKASDED